MNKRKIHIDHVLDENEVPHVLMSQADYDWLMESMKYYESVILHHESRLHPDTLRVLKERKQDLRSKDNCYSPECVVVHFKSIKD
jgi:hypothetical protein